jgi:hypothetical protein
MPMPSAKPAARMPPVPAVHAHRRPRAALVRSRVVCVQVLVREVAPRRAAAESPAATAAAAEAPAPQAAQSPAPEPARTTT